MRFTYKDSRGKEIALDSVEALAARIELGAVDALTELYDASTDTWGPAESHEIFRQLLAEAAARDLGAAFSPPVPAAGSPPPESAPLSNDDALSNVDSLTRLAASDTFGSTDADDDEDHTILIDGALELEDTSEDISVNSAAVSREPPMDGFRARVADPWEAEARLTEEEPAEEPVETPRAAAKLEIDDSWGSSGEHPFDSSDAGADGDGGWPEAAFELDDEPEPSGIARVFETLSIPAVQWTCLAAAVLVMAFFGSAAAPGLLLRTLLTVVGVVGVGAATGLVLWKDPERRTLIPAATFGLIVMMSVPLFLVGTRVEAATSPDSTRTAQRPTVAPGDAPAANPGEAAMEGRAMDEVIEGLDSLAVAYGLNRRPADWLHGIYLANASKYPEVEDYWQRYGAYLDEVRSQDAEWFRQSYEDRLTVAGINPSAVQGLVDRGMQRFHSTAVRRQQLYSTMQDLVNGSLELHVLLMEREDDIAYDPFDDGGVSDAPVVEAVPNSPELEDEMWALIGRIALALESISDVGDTAPTSLQSALVDSVRASIR